jgi:hypothetical protein
MTTALAATPEACERRRARRFGWALIALALPVLILGGLSAGEGWRTLDWPRVPAEILASAPEPATTGTSGPPPSGAVLYRYRIGGRERTGDAIEPALLPLEATAFAERHRRRYPAGAWALAAVDPADPKIAYLEPGPSTAALIALGLGLLAGLSGASILALSRAPRQG